MQCYHAVQSDPTFKQYQMMSVTVQFVFLQLSRHQTFDNEPKAYTFMESSFLQLTHTEILESIKPVYTI